VGEPISARRHELHLPYAPVPQEEDNQSSQRSHADASVGTEDVEVDAPDGRMVRRRTTVHEVLATLDSGVASRMLVELAPSHSPRTLDVQNDLAQMVCGRSVAALAIWLRWVGIVIGILGGAVPILVIFVVHWASGGPGQFALAYEWPLWLEVWMCVGWWLTVCVLLLFYASMQREIAWMALKQASTLWSIAMTGVFVAALVRLYEFGVLRSTWVDLPAYVGCALCFPLGGMADALPPKLRLPFLRFAGLFVLGAAASVALVLHLPTAEDTPGEPVDGDGHRHGHEPAGADILVHGVDGAARQGRGEELGLPEQACVHPNELGRRGMRLWRHRGARSACGARFWCERCAALSRFEFARVKPWRFAGRASFGG
jgi:hypothetical protein